MENTEDNQPSFARSLSMDAVRKVMETHGIGLGKLADHIDIKRTSLSNKFTSASAMVDYEDSPNRDFFTEAQAQAVRTGIETIITDLQEALTK